MNPPTVSDVLRAHADRLTPHLLNDDLPDEAACAIGNAQRTIRIVADLGECHRVKARDLEPKAPRVVCVEDARLKVKELRASAARWRPISADTGMAFTPLAEDYIRELEAEANALEAQIPLRPWASYITAALLCYALGALTAWGVL